MPAVVRSGCEWGRGRSGQRSNRRLRVLMTVFLNVAEESCRLVAASENWHNTYVGASAIVEAAMQQTLVKMQLGAGVSKRHVHA